MKTKSARGPVKNALKAPGKAPRHILHVIPSFGIGGVSIRVASLIDHFGPRFHHHILSLDGRYECLCRISNKAVSVEGNNTAQKKSIWSRLSKIRQSIRRVQPDLLITYNWGAIEWTLGGNLERLCPQIHIEDGFGIEEAAHLLRRRNVLRRVVLARVARVVVPSQTLFEIARRIWRVPEARLRRIPNGIDCERFTAASHEKSNYLLPQTMNRLVVGTVAPLRPEKRLGYLLEIFARLPLTSAVVLLIIGDGPEKSSLMQLAQHLRIEDRTIFGGTLDRVEEGLASIDIFAVTSATEQMPFAVLQAMAAGKPVVSLDAGDIREMLSPENRPFVIAGDDKDQFQEALIYLTWNKSARLAIGRANRERVMRLYNQSRMFALYDKLLTEILQDDFEGDTSVCLQNLNSEINK